MAGREGGGAAEARLRRSPHPRSGRAAGAVVARVSELRSPDERLRASFVTEAGMLGWSLFHQGVQLLAHPVPFSTYVEQGTPTGIALLHPWANRLASPEYEIAGRRVRLDMSASNVQTDPNGLPIHGLAAASPHWEVVEKRPARLSARLDYAAWPELAAGFPFPHVLELSARLWDEGLEIDVELKPTADVPVPVAFGFHPHLRLPGLPRERWEMALPVTSRMLLDRRMLPTGESEEVHFPPGPLGDRVFDDAFDGLVDPPELTLRGAQRRVSLRLLEGYRFAQVYAPEGSDFISFEPMTAPINPFESEQTILTKPGSTYRARFDIGATDDRRP